ncbi:helix-turn-helix domain-containing protein [Haematomicrobium sanguinis]|uniref:helix-turn-helix domain-containing protein n=1 Tax=Haematomicrobium sanguinis TaxID=479106 RepID=UPI00047A3BD2|nr:helix-turn-helix domain-containing protein [Haematomicrobium sanguinis]
MAQQRFITLTDVAEILGISGVQARALVTSGELRAIQVGGRGQWRIEQDVLEQYIQDRYRATEKALEEKNRKKAEK